MSSSVRVSLSRRERWWLYGANALFVLLMIAYLRILLYMGGIQ